MFESKLYKFIAKRTAVLFVFLTAADIAFLGSKRWLILAGLTAGVFVSIGRLGGNEWIFKKIFRFIGRKAVTVSIAVFTASQLVLLPVIVMVYFLSVWVLYGFIAGILAVPVVIMINSVTEAFGITKNRFE